MNLHLEWRDTLVQWGLHIQLTLGIGDDLNTSPKRPPLPTKSFSLPHGSHDKKSNGDLDSLIEECGGGSDVNYDSNIESLRILMGRAKAAQLLSVIFA